MAYFKGRTGAGRFRKKKANKDCQCFVCEEPIKKGEDRFVEAHRLSLCIKCMGCYLSEGVESLGQISRAKNNA